MTYFFSFSANEVRFDPVVYTVTEGMQDVVVTLRGRTTFPVQEVTQFHIQDSADSATGITSVITSTLL